MCDYHHYLKNWYRFISGALRCKRSFNTSIRIKVHKFAEYYLAEWNLTSLSIQCNVIEYHQLEVQKSFKFLNQMEINIFSNVGFKQMRNSQYSLQYTNINHEDDFGSVVKYTGILDWKKLVICLPIQLCLL